MACDSTCVHFAQANETKIYNSDVYNIWSKRFMADGFDGDDSLRRERIAFAVLHTASCLQP